MYPNNNKNSTLYSHRQQEENAKITDQARIDIATGSTRLDQNTTNHRFCDAYYPGHQFPLTTIPYNHEVIEASNSITKTVAINDIDANMMKKHHPENRYESTFLDNLYSNDSINATSCIDDQSTPALTPDCISSSGRPGTGQSSISQLSSDNNHWQTDTSHSDFSSIPTLIESIRYTVNQANTINASLPMKSCRYEQPSGSTRNISSSSKKKMKWRCFAGNCAKIFCSASDLWRHLSPEHLNYYPVVYKCLICNKQQYTTRREIARNHVKNCLKKERQSKHLPEHQQQPLQPTFAEINQNIVIIDNPYDFYFCTFEGCNDMSFGYNTFKKHVFSKHDNINNEKLEYFCPDCDKVKTFSRFQSILIHKQKHCSQPQQSHSGINSSNA